MTDQEFTREIRRGLIIIMRAVMMRYGLAWTDFLPREENEIIRALAGQLDTALCFDCALHGERLILRQFQDELRLACGCVYRFQNHQWERLVTTDASTPKVAFAYRVKT